MGSTRVEPGFWWSPSRQKDADGRTIGTAKIEVIKLGTRGRVRRRFTLERVTYQEAEQRLKRERARLNGGEQPLPVTFGEFLDLYGDECLEKVGAGTRKTYAAAIRNHIRPFFGSKRLAAFATSGEYEIDRFVQVLRKKRKKTFLKGRGVVDGATTLTPQTINGVLRILRLLANHARKAGLITSVPKEPFKPLKEPRRDHTVRLPELTAFFRTFESEAAFRAAYATKLGHEEGAELYGLYFDRHRWLKPFFVCAADTGWRRGDLLGLQWADVDLDAGVMSVVMQKTGDLATAGITPAIRAALEELKARKVVSSTHVFLGWQGRPLSATSVRRAFELGKELAGLTRRLKFHGIRHAVGYRLAAAAVPLYLIQHQLGHASAKTCEIYLKAAGDHIGIATEALVKTSWAKEG